MKAGLLKNWRIIVWALLILSNNSCKKDEYDLPCFDSFSCYINGQSFTTRSSWGCSAISAYHYSDIEYIGIRARDCTLDLNEVGYYGVYLVFDSINEINYKSREGLIRVVYFNNLNDNYLTVLQSNVRITEFIPSNFSEDFSGGYVKGYFSGKAYNESIEDTVLINSGNFCIRLN